MGPNGQKLVGSFKPCEIKGKGEIADTFKTIVDCHYSCESSVVNTDVNFSTDFFFYDDVWYNKSVF